MTTTSHLFQPFRAIGFITNHVPFDLQSAGPEHFITTCIGKSFHIYNASKLQLKFVGQSVVDPIAFLLSVKKSTMVGTGTRVVVYIRGKQVREYTEHAHTVHSALSLGNHIISADEGGVVNVWDYNSLDTYLSFNLDPKIFRISALMHPSTYLNKVLLASLQGTMQLRNVKTNSLVYEFSGWNSAIVVVEQAPAVDVVAVGLESGRVVLHNIKFDETLMSFAHEEGPITSISFRTDGEPIMATGSTSGHVSLWDLEKKKLSHFMDNCHDGTVAGLSFMNKQPCMVTSGSDNALKVWIFDNPDGSGRLLKKRDGHSGPPTKCLYYDDSGQIILTPGHDRTLRYQFTIRDEQSHELSQGKLASRANKKHVHVSKLRLRPITALAAESRRNQDWASIVTCHQGEAFPRLWNLKGLDNPHPTLGFSADKRNLKGLVAKAVDVSSCGNFALVGYNTGLMLTFNIQSRQERGEFVDKDGKLTTGHKGCVQGVAFDNCNLNVMSAGSDCMLKFWSFKDKQITHRKRFDCIIAMIKLHRESGLLAVALDDFTVKIVDIDTKKIVREFPAHRNAITDMSFSNDSRWLVTASMDGTVKSWDVPAARLLDAFLVEKPVIGLAISPTSEYLTTTHVDDLGVYLWSNNVVYTGIYPSPLPTDYEPTEAAQLPKTGAEEVEVEEEDDDTDDLNEAADRPSDDADDMEILSAEQLGEDLITLSLLPESRWKSLVNLDLIKARNKPIEPPKKPKAAPFFLPTLAGLEMKFDLTTSTEQGEQDANSKTLQSSMFDMDTEFQAILKRSCKCQDYSSTIEKLKGMSPSQIDVELRTVSPDAGGSMELMSATLQCFTAVVAKGTNYEFVQGCVALFLKLHASTIASSPELQAQAAKLLTALRNSWTRCENLINQSICLVNYFKSATI